MPGRRGYLLSAVLSLLLSAISWWQLDHLAHSEYALHQDGWYTGLFLGLIFTGLLSLSICLICLFDFLDSPKSDQA